VKVFTGLVIPSLVPWASIESRLEAINAHAENGVRVVLVQSNVGFAV
jgi:hypothetical protein